MKLETTHQCTECGHFRRKTIMLGSAGVTKAYICEECLSKAIQLAQRVRCWFCGRLSPNHHPLCAPGLLKEQVNG